MPSAANPQPDENIESRRYREDELDLMDEIPSPRLNPWLSLGLLILLGFLYLWGWRVVLLKGQ